VPKAAVEPERTPVARAAANAARNAAPAVHWHADRTDLYVHSLLPRPGAHVLPQNRSQRHALWICNMQAYMSG